MARAMKAGAMRRTRKLAHSSRAMRKLAPCNSGATASMLLQQRCNSLIAHASHSVQRRTRKLAHSSRYEGSVSYEKRAAHIYEKRAAHSASFHSFSPSLCLCKTRTLAPLESSRYAAHTSFSPPSLCLCKTHACSAMPLLTPAPLPLS